MQPDNRRQNSTTIPARQYLHPQDDTRQRTQVANATAQIVRDQIGRIYDSSTPAIPITPAADDQSTTSSQAPPAGTKPVEKLLSEQFAKSDNPYERTHDTANSVSSSQWKDYHSAWQNYYQQYYHRFYLGQVYEAHQKLEQTAATNSPGTQSTSSTEHIVSKEEALAGLRGELRSKLRKSTQKVRSSRHFMPGVAAIGVMLLFLFLQYNQLLFANVQAYISPGNINPTNIITQPGASDIPVGPEPKLIIPKINVDVPVIYDVTADHESQMKAMENGVAWFGIPGANSKPGQIGNTVLSGHSSNDWLEGGKYKFIFARLEQMETGDMIYLHYGGVRYSYTITRKEVVAPTDVSKLIYQTDKPILTLITCTPLGTSLNRLLVTAEQVSPSPSAAAKAPDAASSDTTSAMPGSSPTLIERLFGAR